MNQIYCHQISICEAHDLHHVLCWSVDRQVHVTLLSFIVYHGTKKTSNRLLCRANYSTQRYATLPALLEDRRTTRGNEVNSGRGGAADNVSGTDKL